MTRVFVGLGLVATLTVSLPAVAFASHRRIEASSAHQNHPNRLSYRYRRHQIQLKFQNSVASARVSYLEALTLATTSAERASAQQDFEAAIIAAAAIRTSELITLGPPPNSA